MLLVANGDNQGNGRYQRTEILTTPPPFPPMTKKIKNNKRQKDQEEAVRPSEPCVVQPYENPPEGLSPFRFTASPINTSPRFEPATSSLHSEVTSGGFMPLNHGGVLGESSEGITGIYRRRGWCCSK